MNVNVKFKWEGTIDDESGLAVFEIGASTYSMRFPKFRSANLMHIALCNAYQQGLEDGSLRAKAAMQSALSKIPY